MEEEEDEGRVSEIHEERMNEAREEGGKESKEAGRGMAAKGDDCVPRFFLP